MLGLAALLLAASCNEDVDVRSVGERWPDYECHRLGQDFQVDPVLATDAALVIFRQHVLPRARESGGHFPAYYEWLDEVTRAVGLHESSDGGDASDRAQSELESFIPPVPATHDVQTRAAWRQQTRFREMAANITTRMRCQADDRRSAAVDHLWSTYSLPR